MSNGFAWLAQWDGQAFPAAIEASLVQRGLPVRPADWVEQGRASWSTLVDWIGSADSSTTLPLPLPPVPLSRPPSRPVPILVNHVADLLGFMSDESLIAACETALAAPEQVLIETALLSSDTPTTGWVGWLPWLTTYPTEATLWTVSTHHGVPWVGKWNVDEETGRLVLTRFPRIRDVPLPDGLWDVFRLYFSPLIENGSCVALTFDHPMAPDLHRAFERQPARLLQPDPWMDMQIGETHVLVCDRTRGVPHDDPARWPFYFNPSPSSSLPPPPLSLTPLGTVRILTRGWVVHEVPCLFGGVDVPFTMPLDPGRLTLPYDPLAVQQAVQFLVQSDAFDVLGSLHEALSHLYPDIWGEIEGSKMKADLERHHVLFAPPHAVPFLRMFVSRLVPWEGLTEVSPALEEALARSPRVPSHEWTPSPFSNRLRVLWIPSERRGASRCGTRDWLFLGGRVRPDPIDVAVAFPELMLTLKPAPSPAPPAFPWLTAARQGLDPMTWPQTLTALTRLGEAVEGLRYFVDTRALEVAECWMLNPIVLGFSDASFPALVDPFIAYLQSMYRVHTVAYGSDTPLIVFSLPPPPFTFSMGAAIPLSAWVDWVRATFSLVDARTERIIPVFPPVRDLAMIPPALLATLTDPYEVVIAALEPQALPFWRAGLSTYPPHRDWVLASQWDDDARASLRRFLEVLVRVIRSPKPMSLVPPSPPRRSVPLTSDALLTLTVSPDPVAFSLSQETLYATTPLLTLVLEGSPWPWLDFLLETVPRINSLQPHPKRITFNGHPLYDGVPPLSFEWIHDHGTRSVAVLRFRPTEPQPVSWLFRDWMPWCSLETFFRRAEQTGTRVPAWIRSRMAYGHFILVKEDAPIPPHLDALTVATVGKWVLQSLFFDLATFYLSLPVDDPRRDNLLLNSTLSDARLLEQVRFREPPLKTWARQDAFLANTTTHRGYSLSTLINATIDRYPFTRAKLETLLASNTQIEPLERALVVAWWTPKLEPVRGVGSSLTVLAPQLTTLTEAQILHFYQAFIDAFWAVGQQLALPGTAFTERPPPRLRLLHDPRYAGVYVPETHTLFLEASQLWVPPVWPQTPRDLVPILRARQGSGPADPRHRMLFWNRAILPHELMHAWVPPTVVGRAYHPDVEVDGQHLFFDEAAAWVWRQVLVYGFVRVWWEGLSR